MINRRAQSLDPLGLPQLLRRLGDRAILFGAKFPRVLVVSEGKILL